MDTDRSTEYSRVPSRRGWQLPQTPAERDVAGSQRVPAATAAPTEFRPDPRPRPDGVRPTMRGSVVGQVTKVEVGSVMVNKEPDPVVIVRVERHVAHEGRTSIKDIRLQGGDALGFASAGDWVEAVGKEKSGTLRATRAVNHTTNAVYQPSSFRRHRTLIALLVFLIFVTAMVCAFVYFVRVSDDNFRDFNSDRQLSSVEQCLATGAPRELCEQFK